MKKVAFLLLLVFLLSQASANSFYQAIYQKIADQQILEPSAFALSNDNQAVKSWYKIPGLFAANVSINFSGSDIAKLLRHHIAIYDNNFFVTAWTLESLIASQSIGAVNIDSGLLNRAINAELSFNDKNHPDTTLITFWPQTYAQAYWEATPRNLNHLFQEADVFANDLQHACRLVHSQAKCDAFFAKKMPFIKRLPSLAASFHIPPDTDDTALNLSLGAMLYEHRHAGNMTQAYELWRSVNTDEKIKAALQALMQYTYQISASTLDNNLLDPRSYFAMHDYLDSVYQNSPSLVTTWAMNLSEEQQEEQTGFSALPVAMPFNVNNIDPTVEANFIYAIEYLDKAGLLKEVLAGDTTLQQQINHAIKASADYVNWVLQQDLAFSRPDIALVYYPAKYNLYWFVSRIVKLDQDDPNLNPILQNVALELGKTLRSQGTQILLKSMMTDLHQTAYWDDFLGDNDRGHGREYEADDRIYSTAVVLNALLNIWTQPDPANPGRFVWVNGIDDNLKLAIMQGAAFLKENILNGAYRKDNVFFSGSVKGLDSLPFYYPANYYAYTNGEVFQPTPTTNLDNTVVVGMQGHVDANTYQQLIASQHFGRMTPTKFTGFNTTPFPFWDAPVLTYSFSLEAIAKYDAITQ